MDNSPKNEMVNRFYVFLSFAKHKIKYFEDKPWIFGYHNFHSMHKNTDMFQNIFVQ